MPVEGDAVSSSRQPVAVLHARQHVEIGLDEVFPPDRFDVTVFTIGDPVAVFRLGVPAGAAAVVRTNPASAATAIRDRLGARAEIVTNDEYCLELCAGLRREFGLPSRHPAVIAHYRDKVSMKRALVAAGIATPDFIEMTVVHPGDGASIADKLGLPVVVKPRAEANTRGVQILKDRPALTGWLTAHEGERGWHAEAFVAGTHGHANALVRHGRIDHVLVGAYRGSLLDLGAGRPAGGVTLPAGDPMAVAGRALATAAVRALGDDGDFVVHAEFVVDASGRASIVEVAARAPGALVSEAALLHSRIHLVAANYLLQIGGPVPTPVDTGVRAGWLWYPAGSAAADTVRRPALTSPYRLTLHGIAAPADRAGFVVGAALLVWSADDDLLAADLTASIATPLW